MLNFWKVTRRADKEELRVAMEVKHTTLLRDVYVSLRDGPIL